MAGVINLSGGVFLNILVTGGTGYIGSHTCAALLEAVFSVVVFDNLCNSRIDVIDKIHEITGKRTKFIEGDLLDEASLDKAFSENTIDAVMHLAALKAVGESVSDPLRYYQNNVVGTINLCHVMAKHDCRRLVFSSSATVYGTPKSLPYTEDMPLAPVNPYGETKRMMEQILTDLQKSDPRWSIALLRYFNPIGAHDSGLIGETPDGIPNNLMPYITQVAAGKLPYLNVFGDDYDTPDGTGVRDYLHVMDLAEGHICALKKISGEAGLFTYNLGTGRGYSVLDIINSFEKANGIKIPYKISPRRGGDIAAYYADPSKAERELGWRAKRDLEDMCGTSWRFVCQNA